MPRMLSDDLNELIIQDNLSGSEILFQYRLPTTKERVAYTNACIERKGRKVINKSTEARIRYGAKILAGIRAGDFILPGGKTVSSDPTSPHYDENWKEKVKAHAADLIELLAVRVYDTPAQTAVPDAPDDEEPGPEGGPEGD